MSSTNRGYDRHKSDYYITPQSPIEEFLSVFLATENIERPDRMNWLDPCAGGDSSHAMSYPAVIASMFDPNVLATNDIREDSLAESKLNYLEAEFKDFDFIITNPPFHIAREIIEKALNDVNEDGFVIMLLRLNFWGSKARRDFLLENLPKYCFIHPRRMSFTEDGKTDSIEYAHFVWQKGYVNDFCKTILL